jgi:hypothetical protein
LTISSTTRKAGPFTGTGAQVAFSFAYKVFSAADVLVVQAVTATGVETTKVLTTDYSVTLNADQNANPGGTVTMLVAPPVGTTLTLASRVDNLQPTDLTNAGGFYPSVINAALDRCVIQIQQLAEKLGRTLSISISSSSSGQLPAPVALALLGWNSTATAIQNFAGIASVAVSTFMATVVSAIDAATARASLGAAASGPLAASGITGASPRATRINVASVAGTVDLTANAPNTDDIQITGALAITGFTVATDRVLRVTAGGAFTLTNGGGLVTQTGANIVAAVGDTFMLRATAANVVEVLNYVAVAGPANAVLLTGNQTIAGTKTFSSQPVVPAQSMVRLHTSNGYGSSSTVIPRFTTVVTNQGSDITYADSATLGSAFTINTNGVYAISFGMTFANANAQNGLSLNSSQLTTAIASIASADRLGLNIAVSTSGRLPVSNCLYLPAGSVIRPHADGGTLAGAAETYFTIQRVG